MSHFNPCLVLSHGLSLNGFKSEALLPGQRLSTFPAINSVNTASYSVAVSKQITTLGVILDNNLTFDSHVSAVCKKSFSTAEFSDTYVLH